MNTIVISKRTNGRFLVVVNGCVSPVNTINYRVSSGMEIYDGIGKLIGSGYPADFTVVIDGVDNTGFTSYIDICDKIDYLIDKVNSRGITTSETDAVLSDTENLTKSGWIVPTLADGTIKYVTVAGETRIKTFVKGELSIGLVRQVFLTGTTADLGIVVHS